MKIQKGFIQISILIAVIVGVLVLGGAGYFGVRQYQNYRVEKIEKEKEAQALAEAQKKSLEEAQQEIEKLKEGSVESRKKQEALEQKVSSGQQKSISQNLSISAAELEPYLTGVVHLFCGENEGSGSLWNFDNLGYSLLTNQHVAKNNKGWECIIGNTGKGAYKTESVINSFNTYTDSAILKINPIPISDGSWPISDLNYKISSLGKCPVEMPLGTPVVIIGYPAYAENLINIPGEQKQATQSYRTVSNGIISAHDSSVQVPYGKLPYINYFISAKIDSGNSGGVAISKDKNDLCFLGIPTWLTVGNYETQGVVQNIHNITSQQ